MKSTNVAAYGDRPPTRCGWCLKPAWSNTDTCRECRSIEPNLRLGYTEADELTGGQWVTVGGVQRWQWDVDPTPQPPRNRPLTLPPDAARRGYSQYRQGFRTEFAITAYREYQRAHKRARRTAA